MTYSVTFTRAAEDELARLSSPIAQRVLDKLKWYAERADDVPPEPLHGDLKGVFKLRVGDFRVAYTLDRDRRTIRVQMVGHRSKIYRLRD